MPNHPHSILGIDPGYDRLGWAIAQNLNDQWTKIHYGCIQTKKKDDLFKRYQDLNQELEKIIQQFKPDQAAVESLFFFKNKKTALQVSEARGIILACLIKNKVKIFEYTPLQIKEAVTGFGRADKKSVEKMVRLEFQLNDQKIIDDAIDALALILTHHILIKNKKYYC
ncbi:MAG: crossover junction endodeoxyribonuclease RuvC [Candidatus Woesebacteria bacterium]|jgi:crossover junction endodeoxyribonuclease RuvC